MAEIEADSVTLELSSGEALVLVHLLTSWAFGEGPTPAADCFEHPADVHALLALTHEISPRLSGQSEGYEARLAEARRRLMERYEAPLRTLRE